MMDTGTKIKDSNKPITCSFTGCYGNSHLYRAGRHGAKAESEKCCHRSKMTGPIEKTILPGEAQSCDDKLYFPPFMLLLLHY